MKIIIMKSKATAPLSYTNKVVPFASDPNLDSRVKTFLKALNGGGGPPWKHYLRASVHSEYLLKGW
jgi:hypothetical protein